MRVDLHIHPLSHRYYYDNTYPAALSERDISDIAAVLRLSVKRGLDAVSITDHDFPLSGMWAQDYAMREKMPLLVLPGCECELYHRGQWIHVLAINLRARLQYTAFTPPAELCGQIKAQGAVSVLAHPMCYPEEIYHDVKQWVDGIEYRNGAQERMGRETFGRVLDRDGYQGLRLHNSDTHYPESKGEPQWSAMTKMSHEEFRRWFP